MSAQPNVWQTRSSRHSQSHSRTPTSNRSATASPGPAAGAGPRHQTPPAQPPPAKNVWAQRSTSSSHERQAATTEGAGDAAPLNSFNREEVRKHLAGEGEGVKEIHRVGGGSKGAANLMANGQPFLGQLAKQLATLEGGG